jgi:hypothetical protein
LPSFLRVDQPRVDGKDSPSFKNWVPFKSLCGDHENTPLSNTAFRHIGHCQEPVCAAVMTSRCVFRGNRSSRFSSKSRRFQPKSLRSLLALNYLSALNSVCLLIRGLCGTVRKLICPSPR